ncbi:hypothetical protein HO133_005040 [Letharia lupina]|uniref:Expansin-like EG45 domain-containing protein n=1 Tax=Letharia lupina TaxID=560253 RepID=A0A8H6F8L6_9LECA|nr:uncharacterized protein HO133_005040 [Letharia lupina]KAF6219215.1 hypothetical protein HO133_005040 [Letharia lupina]
MSSLALFTTLTLGGLKTLTMANPIAQQITPTTQPDGYQPGYSTQDWEPYGQQSACTINGGVCSAPTPLFPTTSGPDQLPYGVYAAAMVGLGPDDCTVCGTCYSIINSGTPYCDPNGPACPTGIYSGNEEQDGPSQIKILITNHCPDCAMINVTGQVQGHFDINLAPGGWDNAKIYYMQLDDSECT